MSTDTPTQISYCISIHKTGGSTSGFKQTLKHGTTWESVESMRLWTSESLHFTSSDRAWPVERSCHGSFEYHLEIIKDSAWHSIKVLETPPSAHPLHMANLHHLVSRAGSWINTHVLKAKTSIK